MFKQSQNKKKKHKNEKKKRPMANQIEIERRPGMEEVQYQFFRAGAPVSRKALMAVIAHRACRSSASILSGWPILLDGEYCSTPLCKLALTTPRLDGTCADLIPRRGFPARLGPEHTGRLLRQVLAALVDLQRVGLVHCSVGPSAICFARRGPKHAPDFFLGELHNCCCERSGCSYSKKRALYLPWERVFRSGPAGPASDVFALGLTVLHILSGEDYPLLSVGSNPTDLRRRYRWLFAEGGLRLFLVQQLPQLLGAQGSSLSALAHTFLTRALVPPPHGPSPVELAASLFGRPPPVGPPSPRPLPLGPPLPPESALAQLLVATPELGLAPAAVAALLIRQHAQAVPAGYQQVLAAAALSLAHTVLAPQLGHRALEFRPPLDARELAYCQHLLLQLSDFHLAPILMAALALRWSWNTECCPRDWPDVHRVLHWAGET